MLVFGAILRKKIETNHVLEMAYHIPLMFRNLRKNTKFDESLSKLKQFSYSTNPVSTTRKRPLQRSHLKHFSPVTLSTFLHNLITLQKCIFIIVKRYVRVRGLFLSLSLIFSFNILPSTILSFLGRQRMLLHYLNKFASNLLRLD